MEEFYVTDSKGHVIGSDSPSNDGRDDVARDDVENDVLFRYHPTDEHAVRSQFVAVDDDGDRERRVAVSKYRSAPNNLNEHEKRLSKWANAVDSSVPGSKTEWPETESIVQGFHHLLINRNANLGADVGDAFDTAEPVTIDAPQIGDAADIINYALLFEPGSIAVSLHGRTKALDGVDIVVHAGHGESIEVHTAEADERGGDVHDDAVDTDRRDEGGGAEPNEVRGAERDASERSDRDAHAGETDDGPAENDRAETGGAGRKEGRRDRTASGASQSRDATEVNDGSRSRSRESRSAGSKGSATPAGEKGQVESGAPKSGASESGAPKSGASESGVPGASEPDSPDPPSGPEAADEGPEPAESGSVGSESETGDPGATPVPGSPVPANATVPPDPSSWYDASAPNETGEETEPVPWFPTAPGLSVFDGPTGRLVYDESGRLTPDETYGAANDVYLDDLLFYHNPAAGEVIAYTNGRVGGANQQLLVHYLDPNAENLIREFLSATERLFADRSGWAIARDVGNYQEVFNGLDDDATAEPAVSSEELDSVLRPGTRLDFGTPSAREAIEFVTYLRDERGFDGTVAISGSGRADFLDGVDVVVMPSSLNYTDVEPRAQTGDRIAFARLADSAAAAKREFLDVRERSVDGEVLPRRWQETLATAVSEASERAPTLRPAPAYRLQQASKALVVVATAAVLFLAAVGYLAWSGLGGAFVAALTEPVTVRALPGVTVDALSPVQPLFVPLWGLLAVVGGIAAVGAAATASRVVGVRDAFKPLAYLVGGGTDSLDRKSAGQVDSMRESVETAGELIDEVDDEFLHDRVNEWYEADGINASALVADEPADQYLEVVFEHATEGIDVVDPEADARRRRGWLVTGIAGGVAVGAVVAAVTVGVAYAFTAEVGAAVFATVVFGQVLLVGLLAVGGVAVARRGD
jgi:hypothetical protein